MFLHFGAKKDSYPICKHIFTISKTIEKYVALGMHSEKKQKILIFVFRLFDVISKFEANIGNVGVYVKRCYVKQV